MIRLSVGVLFSFNKAKWKEFTLYTNASQQTTSETFSPSFVEKIEIDEWDERMNVLIVNGEIEYPQGVSSSGDWI